MWYISYGISVILTEITTVFRPAPGPSQHIWVQA